MADAWNWFWVVFVAFTLAIDVFFASRLRRFVAGSWRAVVDYLGWGLVPAAAAITAIWVLHDEAGLSWIYGLIWIPVFQLARIPQRRVSAAVYASGRRDVEDALTNLATELRTFREDLEARDRTESADPGSAVDDNSDGPTTKR